jgi:hypothetical protein
MLSTKLCSAAQGDFNAHVNINALFGHQPRCVSLNALTPMTSTDNQQAKQLSSAEHCANIAVRTSCFYVPAALRHVLILLTPSCINPPVLLKVPWVPCIACPCVHFSTHHNGKRSGNAAPAASSCSQHCDHSSSS